MQAYKVMPAHYGVDGFSCPHAVYDNSVVVSFNISPNDVGAKRKLGEMLWITFFLCQHNLSISHG